MLKDRLSLDLARAPTDVWVVAPQFPAFNQPWIDTYLEQLIANDFHPTIFSCNRFPTACSKKVTELNLLKDLIWISTNGRDVVFNCLKKPRSFLNSFFTIKWMGRFERLLRKRIRLSLFLGWLEEVARQRGFPSVIHSHCEAHALAFLPFSRKYGIPILLTFHGLPPYGVIRLQSFDRAKLYDGVDKVIVNTQFAAKQVRSFGCDDNKITVLPQGVPLRDFQFSTRKPPMGDEPLKLLSVGRFHREKGHHYALLALRRLLDSGISVKYTFIGVGPDLPSLQRLAEKLDLSENVRLINGLPSEEVRSHFKSSHIFILASIHAPGTFVETQGVVLQEAQAMGCIPVATRTGGVPEVINHLKDGLLIDQQSSREIFRSVRWLVENPTQWNNFQLLGRKNVEDKFSSVVIGRQMAEIIKSVY